MNNIHSLSTQTLLKQEAISWYITALFSNNEAWRWHLVVKHAAGTRPPNYSEST